MPTDIRHAEVAGTSIAYRFRPGRSPALLFLPGYASDMEGTKAVALDTFAEAQGLAMLRFDYSGTGSSGGSFEEGTLGGWLDEALHMLDNFVDGPAVIVGSSMGGWLALLLLQALKERNTTGSVAGLVLIAPAVDFTEELMWKNFSAEVKRQIETEGSWQRPSQYSESAYPITRGLIEDGRKHLLLGGLIETGCPVRILQGVQDPDVPWQHAVELSSRLARDDVVLTLVKDGDHRLSRPEDIERLTAAVAEF